MAQCGAKVGTSATWTKVVQAAHEAQSQATFRARALDVIADEVPHDAAIFHALNPRVPLDTGAFRGLDPRAIAATMPHWDQYAVDLARWRDVAMERGGVAIDTDAFAPSDRRRLPYFLELARPLGLRSGMLAHLTMRERIVSVVALFRKRAPAFSASDADRMRALAPVLAVADAALADKAVGMPIARLRCVDDRLTPRQRELVERVALGHTNREIADGLGVSENTVRNQLAVVFKKLGAANRAEAVHHAVLR